MQENFTMKEYYRILKSLSKGENIPPKIKVRNLDAPRLVDYVQFYNKWW